MSVIDYVVHHEGLKAYGITYDMAKEKLLSVGFAEDDSGMAPASLTKQARGSLGRGLGRALPLPFSEAVPCLALTPTLTLLGLYRLSLDPNHIDRRWAASPVAGA